jgi:hypothetical protein
MTNVPTNSLLAVRSLTARFLIDVETAHIFQAGILCQRIHLGTKHNNQQTLVSVAGLGLGLGLGLELGLELRLELRLELGLGLGLRLELRLGSDPCFCSL